MLTVSEKFYSIQGEGSTMGIPAVFLRLAGCNLMCGGFGTEKDKKLHGGAKWRCDTIEVWRKGKKYRWPELVGEMNEEFNFLEVIDKGAHLVITGGEPLLQQDEIINFLKYLHETEICMPFVEIETNGTIMPKDELIHYVSKWNVSPKLESSGMTEAFHPIVLEKFNELKNSIFKFVVTDEREVSTIMEWINLGYIKRTKVWLMPAASSRNEIDISGPWVAQRAIENCVKFSSRLQVEIWDKTTGV